MKWAVFLHIYQPAEQQRDILDAVVTQSYRPLVEGLKSSGDVKITLNINGALTELLDKNGYKELLSDIKGLAEDGKLEFTGSAKYHTLLPFLNNDEIKRQIDINNEVNSKFFGNAYNPKGFFPPEMAWDSRVVPLLKCAGFEWIVLDEIALGGEVGQVDYTKTYNISGTDMKVYFRERRMSNGIMSAAIRTKKTLLEALNLNQEMKNERYLLTAMDGETFGHHRPGLEKFLFEILNMEEFEFVGISDLEKYFMESTEAKLVPCTWASSQADIKKGIQFLSWNDPDNKIHKWQWEFVRLAENEVHNMDKKHPKYEEVRNMLDIALASDHFWWASAKPWWSMEMVEDGAYRLLKTIRAMPSVSAESLERASKLYELIVSTGFDWQRTGKIREMAREQHEINRIPFKDRTLGKGGAEKGVYYAFIDMMRGLEKEAAENGEYEKAILWRDAVYKIENKQDIYDAINVIDLLRGEISNEEVERVIDEYKKRFYEIRGGQPEQRGA